MLRQYALLFICILLVCDLPAQDCQLNPPTGLFFSDVTSCSVTLHWTSDASSAKYQVSYKLTSSSDWSAWLKVKKDTVFTFTGLNPGKKYDFRVKSKCNDGSQSSPVVKSKKTLPCSPPSQVLIDPVNNNTVKITVETVCPFQTLYVRYSTLTGPKTIQSFTPADFYFINGLDAASAYVFEVSTCKLQLDTWTVPDTVHLPPLPNIIFMLIDDSRADYFSCCGAFPFFETPNVDRIADEGVNFKRAYVATSMCAPSRASIATGLFALKTGVTENGIKLDTSFTTIPQVLQGNGYYTAIVGKNHGTFLQHGKVEFDYSLISLDENQGQIHWGYQGEFVTIDKPSVWTMTDTAIALIERVDDPLFLWLAYRIPHYPNLTLPMYEGDFDDEVLPWLPDTAKYTVNFPSYMYSPSEEAEVHGEQLDSIYRSVLEVIAGLDSSVGNIYKVLENSGKLDNTLLIFMSDNGFTLGSHWLNGKTMAYEPSMRVPLLIRYPEWFAPGTVITDQFAMNLDIAPTIYDATGINYGLPVDGRSLRALYEGEFSRTEMYYLMLHNPNAGAPTKRAIRDQYFKYIHYTCNSDTVEEFFDMVNDSLELTNLINNHIYDSLIQVYRLKFDSIKIEWGDTVVGPIKNCFIENPFHLKQMMEEEEDFPQQPMVYPTITKEWVEVYIPWTMATATLYNEYGQMMGTWSIEETFSKIKFPRLPGGVYYLQLTNPGTESVTTKLIISSD